MTRTICLVTSALVLAAAAPASAQVKVRDHRKGKKAPAVQATGYSPDRGPVGTRVTVTGSGFTPDTQVLIGGHDVTVDDARPDSLSFVVPAHHGDGSIVLRHPGVARDIAVGDFTVLVDVSISRFSPTKGTPGTRVSIRGKGFASGDQVLMNGQPATVNKLSATKIIVTIPDNATTGYLVVTRGDEQVSTAKPFTVLEPAPVIDAVSPASGSPGALVTITGRNFGAEATAYYGKLEMELVRRGAGFIEARVPPNARKSRHIRVSGVSGEATSAAKFALDEGPRIKRIAPEYGHAGDQVEIHGSGFRADDIVTLNGAELEIVQIRATQISVRIPRWAKSGAFVLVRGDVQVVADKAFDVVHTPVVDEFSPAAGEVGTAVTITGRHFTDDVHVYYGAEKLRVKQRTDTSLVVHIPRQAADHAFTVRTRGGETTTSTAFAVRWYPAVSSVSPSKGFVGTRVTLRGDNLRDVDNVYLGPVSLPVVERKAKYIAVEIPPSTSTGVFYVERYNEMYETAHSFTVMEAPTVARFAPDTGEPGTRITVVGDNFTADTGVYFGTLPMSVVERALPTQLIVELPAKAAGEHHIWVKEGSAEARSAARFTAIAPPVISKVSPREGKPGTLVTISGGAFTPQTEVQVGAVIARVVERTGDHTIVFEVPAGVSKKRPYVWVTQNAASARSKRPFEIQPSASLTKLSDYDVTVGAQLVVHGKRFDADTKVYFGNTLLTVTKVDRRGKRLWVDANVTGEDYVTVDDHGVRSRSKKVLVVRPPESPPPDGAPPGVKVRDHRKKKRR